MPDIVRSNANREINKTQVQDCVKGHAEHRRWGHWRLCFVNKYTGKTAILYHQESIVTDSRRDFVLHT